ncbi:MAG: DUF2752 domain-containing protein [Clostridiales Family XIII bacterium]|nr:DUF2752 domain-containing protein [Clostridiales Family XIII bacterium]
MALIFLYKCPIYYFFHVPCPGCGITRAYLSIASLDIKAAFNHHPLFFIALPMTLYIPHRNVLKLTISQRVETIMLFVILCLLMIVYIFKMVNINLLYNF